MLVLSRKCGESVVIGGCVCVVVGKIRSTRIQLIFPDAPCGIGIWREGLPETAKPEAEGTLVLNRRAGEAVCMDPDITIRVLRIYSNNRVQLGFEAPREVLILRGEIPPNAA
jgi:carbon storage regulator CsrA